MEEVGTEAQMSREGLLPQGAVELRGEQRLQGRSAAFGQRMPWG